MNLTAHVEGGYPIDAILAGLVIGMGALIGLAIATIRRKK